MENYIYVLTDPFGKPFYVGKSKNPKRRRVQHISKARAKNKLPVYNKIRKLLRENLSIEVLVIEEASEDKINEREMFWIAEYKRLGHKLFNASLGGEGCGSVSPETIEKIRQIHLGTKRSEETCKKISDARKGIKFSQEHKNNLSIARKKRITSDETKEKMSKASTGKINIKKYVITDPNGVEHITESGLTDFCRQHELSAKNMCKVIKGERKHHKGWSAKYANQLDT